jgi:hypothetical protein
VLCFRGELAFLKLAKLLAAKRELIVTDAKLLLLSCFTCVSRCKLLLEPSVLTLPGFIVLVKSTTIAQSDQLRKPLTKCRYLRSSNYLRAGVTQVLQCFPQHLDIGTQFRFVMFVGDFIFNWRQVACDLLADTVEAERQGRRGVGASHDWYNESHGCCSDTCW